MPLVWHSDSCGTTSTPKHNVHQWVTRNAFSMYHHLWSNVSEMMNELIKCCTKTDGHAVCYYWTFQQEYNEGSPQRDVYLCFRCFEDTTGCLLWLTVWMSQPQLPEVRVSLYIFFFFYSGNGQISQKIVCFMMCTDAFFFFFQISFLVFLIQP